MIKSIKMLHIINILHKKQIKEKKASLFYSLLVVYYSLYEFITLYYRFYYSYC